MWDTKPLEGYHYCKKLRCQIRPAGCLARRAQQTQELKAGRGASAGECVHCQDYAGAPGAVAQQDIPEAPPEEATKFCVRCRRDRPLSEFHRRSKSADGLQSHCKACSLAYKHELLLQEVALQVTEEQLFLWRNLQPIQREEIAGRLVVALDAELRGVSGGQ